MLRRLVITAAAVANLLFFDQAAKVAAVSFLKGRPPRVVIDGFFNLAYVENRGCAWGMLQGHVWPLAIFAFFALGVMVWTRKSIFPPGGWGAAAEVMLYAGVIGNLVDRLSRGCVVDMFHFHLKDAWSFPVFNVADVYITIAAFFLVLALIFSPEGKAGGKDDKA